MNHELYAFGSVVRGDVTPSSDVDILVVPTEDGHTDRYPYSWSIYQRSILGEYFAQGRLFAWHLYRESICLFTPHPDPWLKTLGAPAPYRTAREDVRELRVLLDETLDSIRRGSTSLVYELGLAYTAIRDISMSASWAVMGAPNFSRNAPFDLPYPCPIESRAYAIAMASRHASTRGFDIPAGLEGAAAAITVAPLSAWIDRLQEHL
jgi:hypothetical protein